MLRKAPRFRMTGSTGQGANITIIKLDKRTTLETTRQQHGAIANANQAADGVTNSLEHAAYLPVTTFRNRHAIPAVSTFATARINGSKLRYAVFQRHAFQKPFFFFVRQCAKHANRILPLQAKTRMHQPIGQLTGIGQQQQPFGVQIQTAYRLPLSLEQFRQPAKYRWPVLRVIMCDHLTGRLVIRNHTRRRCVNANANRLAVDLDGVAKLNTLANVCRLGIDGNAPLQNEPLHFQARPQPRLRQDLVQFW